MDLSKEDIKLIIDSIDANMSLQINNKNNCKGKSAQGVFDSYLEQLGELKDRLSEEKRKLNK